MHRDIPVSITLPTGLFRAPTPPADGFPVCGAHRPRRFFFALFLILPLLLCSADHSKWSDPYKSYYMCGVLRQRQMIWDQTLPPNAAAIRERTEDIDLVFRVLANDTHDLPPTAHQLDWYLLGCFDALVYHTPTNSPDYAVICHLRARLCDWLKLDADNTSLPWGDHSYGTAAWLEETKAWRDAISPTAEKSQLKITDMDDEKELTNLPPAKSENISVTKTH